MSGEHQNVDPFRVRAGSAAPPNPGSEGAGTEGPVRGAGSPRVSLVCHALPEQVPFLELMLEHAVSLRGSAVADHLVVLGRAPSRGADPRHRRASEERESWKARLTETDRADRVLDAPIAPARRRELAGRYFTRAAGTHFERAAWTDGLFSELDAIDRAESEHVLLVSRPVFFHCSGPTWVRAALDALERHEELCLLVAGAGPPVSESPEGEAAALATAALRLRSPHGVSSSGYFLCRRSRLEARLQWNPAWRSPLTLEQLISRRRGASGELRTPGTWAVKASYLRSPFSQWAQRIAGVVAAGRCPDRQRGRYELRLDRASERDAWASVLERASPAGPPSAGNRARPRYAPPRVRTALPPARHAPDFGPSENSFSPTGPSSVLLAPYFTKNGNPIYGREKYQRNRPELIEPWWSDVKRLGLHAVVFHDELSEKFVARYTTERVRFVRAELPSRVSCNDFRFVIFRDWLRDHTEVDYAFCTDMFDLRINRDPFAVVGGARWLYAGAQPGKIGRNPYVRAKLYSAYGCSFPDLADQVVLNAGILGGPRELLLPCLDAMVHDLLQAIGKSPSGNHNMGVFNRVLYSTERVWAHGAPLHSEFRAQDRNADVCFVHK